MARIGTTFPFARRAKRLTGATTSPDGSIVRPSGETESVAPASDAREKMALAMPGKIR